MTTSVVIYCEITDGLVSEIESDSGYTDLKKELEEFVGSEGDLSWSCLEKIFTTSFTDFIGRYRVIVLFFFGLGFILYMLKILLPNRNKEVLERNITFVLMSILSAKGIFDIGEILCALTDGVKTLETIASSIVGVMSFCLQTEGLTETAAVCVSNLGFLMGGISFITNYCILPCVTFIFSLGTIGVLINSSFFLSFSKWIKKLVVGIMSILSIVFFGILKSSLTQSVAGDNLLFKITGLGISKAVPVIGSSVSTGMDTVIACAESVKSGAGTFALLLVIHLFFPLIIQSFLLYAVLSLFDFMYGHSMNNTSVFLPAKECVSLVLSCTVCFAVLVSYSIMVLMEI